MSVHAPLVRPSYTLYQPHSFVCTGMGDFDAGLLFLLRVLMCFNYIIPTMADIGSSNYTLFWDFR